MMRDYELTVLFKPDLSEKELDHEIKNFQGLLEKVGAKVKSKNDPVKKNLAYAIRGYREAFYVYLELELKAESVLELDSKLRLVDNVIRHLLIKS